MAKLERKTAKIFGENATSTGNNPEIGQFGSAKAGTYNGTGDIAQIQALSAWSQGWAGAVTADQNFPPLPEMTGVQKVNSYQNAYLLQTGIPEWDSGTTYYANTSFCQVNGTLYQSQTDDNVGNDPTTDTTNWKIYSQPSNYANINLSNLSSDLLVGADEKPIYLKNGTFTASVGNVGSATTPIYLTAGTITPSTYSIANDRFDGQWVSSVKVLSTATEVGIYEIDLSDYLPSDNYNYEIMLYCHRYNGDGSGEATFYTDILPDIYIETKHPIFTFGGFSRQYITLCYVPVGIQRKLYWQIISRGKVGNTQVITLGYRRSGSNT